MLDRFLPILERKVSGTPRSVTYRNLPLSINVAVYFKSLARRRAVRKS